MAKKPLKSQIKEEAEYFYNWYKDKTNNMIGFGVIYDKNLKKYIIDIIYDDEKKRIKSFKDYYLFKDI